MTTMKYIKKLMITFGILFSVLSATNNTLVSAMDTGEFIEIVGKDAQKIAHEKGLYASVMIAQAILESDSGSSQLASEPHYNLFGIKGAYNGASDLWPTTEWDSDGNAYYTEAEFRRYPSYKESLEDYADLLATFREDFYSGSWKVNAPSYVEAAHALTNKYATDPDYGDKLIRIIDAYNLTQFDTK